ncbi:MAG: ABC transporter permease [Siphonobacter sp.]
MLSNYLKIAWRNLLKNRIFSLINIVGLSLGLAVVMLILLFVQDEVSFDRFQEKGDRLYRLNAKYTAPDGTERYNGITGTAHGPAFQREISAIEAICRIKGWNMLVKKGSEGLNEKVMYADSTFFDCFTFPLLKGNPHKALVDLHSVVITEDMAERHFGTTNVLGKTIEIDLDGKFEPFTIAGLVGNPPMNSTIRFAALIPFVRSLPTEPEARRTAETEWMSYHLNTFVLLRKDANAAQVEAQFPKVFQKYAGAEYARLQKEYGIKDKLSFGIQPYMAMHMDARYGIGNGLESGSNATYSYILLGIAGLILFIACVNFVNLTLARSLRRSKEIGIRKVTGSTRSQLISQFLGESFLLTFLAFLPAFGLVELLLPEFSELTKKALKASYLLTPQTIGLFAGLLLTVSLLAGAYPAFVLSGFRPIETLYGRFKLSGRNWMGKSLVVLQFSIAIFLLIATFVFQSQFKFIADTNLGYNSDQVVRLDLPYGRPGVASQLKNSLLTQPGIEQVSLRSSGWRATINFLINNEHPKEGLYFEEIDSQHLPLLQIPIVKGRNFNSANSADSINNILVNEAFVKEYMHDNANVIGQSIDKEDDQKVRKPLTIIGVVKDYHLGSLREKIRPMLWYMGKPDNMTLMYVKLKPNASTVLTHIEQQFHKIVPYFPFSYKFLEDERMNDYGNDNRWKQIITYASLISVLISALGLFGLATLSMEQRTKEIGIRKVLGASVVQISRLLSLDYLKLIAVAFIVAMPLGYYATRQWLDGFVYRISFSWWIFAGAGGLVLLIAMLTVSSQAIRAARANPVKSLKSE